MLTQEQKTILGKPGYYIAFLAVALPSRSAPTFCELLVASMITVEGFVTQSQAQSLRAEICEGVVAVNRALLKIFILGPIPSHMRGYTALSADLDSDAANIAGVIAALGAEQKAKVEATLTDYVGQRPEKDIRRIYADTVGRFNSDAMLYCNEQWGNESLSVDARGMSDGTLRFLAILVALLVRPKSSLLIVEEIDNGLHPSRARLLLDVLKTIGKERAIDILVTTHNPALLDNLGPEMTPFITISHREEASGSSHLTLLEDIAMLPKLLSAGPVGKIRVIYGPPRITL